MSGNDLTAPDAVATPMDAFLERLGLLAASSQRLLADVKRRPSVGQALAVVLLAAAARALADLARSGAASGAGALAGILFSVTAALVGWLASAALWHGVSRLFGRNGRFLPFLCQVGWAGAALWLLLPAAVVDAYAGSRWVHPVGGIVAETLFLLVVWRALRLNYGWTPARAAAVLFAPLVAFAALVAAAVAAGAMAVSGVLLAKLLL
jgi:hypothetical protein